MAGYHPCNHTDICIACGCTCMIIQRDICLRCARFSLSCRYRCHQLNAGVASFVYHVIPCSLLRSFSMSRAGFYAVNRQTVACWHCGVSVPVCALVRTPDEDALKDALLQHVGRSPQCLLATDLLRLYLGQN
ncbi:hypothetical protein V1264_015209 [Littorina saxatilis]|uniref:Uncharacterized protein n=1 Tax=Littorina saxatilis TaxID=31220 RepID=A0AAN9BJH1_9CAEN